MTSRGQFATALGLCWLALGPSAGIARAEVPPLAHAQAPTAAVRVGGHPGYGRVVIDVPPGATAIPRRSGDQVRVVLGGATWPDATPVPPAPWRAAAFAGDTMVLTLRPDAGLRTVRLGDRLVLDGMIAAPVVARLATAPAIEATRRDHVTHFPAPSPPAPAIAPVTTMSAPMVAQPAPAPAPPPIAAPPVFVAAPAGVAAAAFSRAGQGVVVFDAAIVPDLSALPGARLIPLEGAVAITAPHLDGVHEVAGGWALGASAARAATPFVPAADENLLASLPTGAVAGRVVTMPDPEGGGLLLVGTLRPGAAATPVAAIPLAQATPEATIVPTTRGVAVAPLSDAAVLRASAAGWVLATERPDRLASPDPNSPEAAPVAAAVAAAGLAHCLDLPDLPLDELRRRSRQAQESITLAPAGDRARPRLHAAEAMLALGFGVEAAGQVSLAQADDPRIRAEPRTAMLARAAAILADRPPVATAPDGCGPEAVLWDHAAGSFAERAPSDVVLLRAYPAPLRDRLLPLWAVAAATAEPSSAALRALLAGDPDPSLDLARAIAEPDAARALARLDALAAGPDAALHVRAARLAVERRLAAGQIDARAAADAMEPLVVAWRGDASELDARLRLAALRAQSGAWRQALASLRETAGLAEAGAFGAASAAPDTAAQNTTVRYRARATFADALAADALHPMPPLDLLALVEDNAGLLPTDASAVPLADRLADRLAELDLTDRATHALATLAHAAPAGAPRATLGERLGRLRLDAGDPAGALAALADSAALDLPATVGDRRMLLWARATAANGDPVAAALALAGRDDPAALDTRAGLLEAQARWPEATAALSALADQLVPPRGALDATQAAVVVRLATAAARADDEATLARLRDTVTRMPGGDVADQLRLLTDAPVRSVADLPRAGREAVLARAVIAR